MYFIHNKYSNESTKILESLDENVIVIDYYGERERGNHQYELLMIPEKLPCFVTELNYPQHRKHRASDIKNTVEPKCSNEDLLQLIYTVLENQKLILDKLYGSNPNSVKGEV